ncbi:helix-turn-helix domain-containing protein [Leuconostoc suionicum]|uniref:helix-turn-helix domain-containing protein n=1 Tax=Leuconostoc suionicum TaxID=1511761 RepID=UPI00233ED376|nr:helix-turn-helix transcriptional regulator [Leuconostoc suionicum]MDC2806892.1 helix-turn-helix transcriptional regulator [Leuconostoc suionicum]MDC2824404.1 helix-turn-helix transcriptional regulator [Leuconostoc suionicum]
MIEFSTFTVLKIKELSKIIGGTSADIGPNLKKYRKLANISQFKLAQLLSVNQATVSHYESGQRVPDIDSLINLSNILDVDIKDILSI